MDNAFETFAKEVLSFVPRANGDEHQEMHQELVAHMEDCAQALEAKGLSPEEAQTQAVAHMGNPQEIGESLNEEFPILWVWVSRVTTVALMALILCAILPMFYTLYSVGCNLMARFSTDETDFYRSEALENYVSHNESFTINDVIVELHGYGLDPQEDGSYTLVVNLCAYANSPFDEVQSSVLEGFLLEGTSMVMGGSSGNAGSYQAAPAYAITPGTTDVRLHYGRYGVEVETTLAVNWEGIA